MTNIFFHHILRYIKMHVPVDTARIEIPKQKAKKTKAKVSQSLDFIFASFFY